MSNEELAVSNERIMHADEPTALSAGGESFRPLIRIICHKVIPFGG
jgi:hypothetical protein